MRKIPATLVVVVLLMTVASVAARPLLNTATALAPGVVVGLSIGSNTYSVDVTSAASILVSPEKAVSAIIHAMQGAEAKPEQATEPINEREVNAGESVHITHVVENRAVSVSIEVMVTVGEPASVTHIIEPHPPEPEHPGSD